MQNERFHLNLIVQKKMPKWFEWKEAIDGKKRE